VIESLPEKFEGVSVALKANIYFGGRVVSHSVFFKDGSKKTLGLIHEGSFTFTTAQPEVMAIIAGTCRWRMQGEQDWKVCVGGQSFKVPAKAAFEVAVGEGICEYCCSYE
jgi:uncharacterized protein YaiE (UPF0345 family)